MRHLQKDVSEEISGQACFFCYLQWEYVKRIKENEVIQKTDCNGRNVFICCGDYILDSDRDFVLTLAKGGIALEISKKTNTQLSIFAQLG